MSEPIQLQLANPRGFCAGVDRAIEIVNRALDVFGAPIYVRHEVVHNKFVVDNLRDRGAVFVDELDEVPDGAIVIFSAHGVSQAVQREAERLSQEVELARQQQADLLAWRSYVASDLYVEEVARRELKWASPGETVLVVMPSPETATLAAGASEPAISASAIVQTPAQAWWRLFFGQQVSP